MKKDTQPGELDYKNIALNTHHNLRVLSFNIKLLGKVLTQ